MKKVVERNPVIESKAANNVMIGLYACIVFSFVATMIDIIIRFPLQSEYIDYSDIELNQCIRSCDSISIFCLWIGSFIKR